MIYGVSAGKTYPTFKVWDPGIQGATNVKPNRANGWRPYVPAEIPEKKENPQQKTKAGKLIQFLKKLA